MRAVNKLIPVLTEKNKRNFFRKVSTTPTENGCLEWLAGKFKDGYGIFHIGAKTFISHRIAYFLYTGNDPTGLQACHRCDNPSCCNPVHLFLGSHKENMQDKTKKGRGNPPTGDRNGSRTKPESRPKGGNHGLAKLTVDQIILIRADKRSLRAIAREYGVDNSLISRIKRHIIWTHVT